MIQITSYLFLITFEKKILYFFYETDTWIRLLFYSLLKRLPLARVGEKGLVRGREFYTGRRNENARYESSAFYSSGARKYLV